MTNSSLDRSGRIELTCTVTLAALYLVCLRTSLPLGDGPVYARNIDAGTLVLNPNHLLMDPIGLAWCNLLAALGIHIETLDALKFISGIGTIASLVIFREVLIAAGIERLTLRIAAVAGLFASRNFLTMAMSDEFFMVQMPFLMLALLILTRLPRLEPNAARWACAWLGVVLALAVAISINNALLGIAVFVYLLRPTSAQCGRDRAIVMSVSGLAVTLPLFVIAYRLAGSNGGFLEWLLAYQGTSGGVQGTLYGIEPTFTGFMVSTARLAHNTLTNFVSMGPIGTVLKSAIFHEPLELQPQRIVLILGVLLLALAATVLALLLIQLRRSSEIKDLAVVCLAWIAPYYAFNLFWNDSSDQFWFQMLPALWLVIAKVMFERAGTASAAISPRKDGPAWRVTAAVAALLALNTAQEILPNSSVVADRQIAAHRSLLQEGDLEVIPGWDAQRWLRLDESFPAVRQVNLMTAALLPQDDPGHISRLDDTLAAHLHAGGRVVVARLYDLDSDPRPWDQLRKLGWSRQSIQGSLTRFEVVPLERITNVAFRELRLPPDASHEDTGR